jgi:hypothetical protein
MHKPSRKAAERLSEAVSRQETSNTKGGPMKKSRMMILVLAIMLICSAMVVEAKLPRNGKYIDKAGNVYIMSHGKPKTGYFTYKGKHYYGHKTATKKYPKGSLTVGEMRIRDGKWYAYGTDGARIEKDQYVRKGRQRIMQLDIKSRNHSVRYIYGTARTTLGTRYSTRLKRTQHMDDKGKWHDVEGMQYIPYYVDKQR